MLHFVTALATHITEPFSLVISFACLSQPINLSPLFCDNTANQPANGWFLFLRHQICQKIRYFMLRSNHATVGNVSVELAT